MKNEDEHLRRLPPPPLFTLRPPPKPPGTFFDHFQTGQIYNGQCRRPTLNLFNSTSSKSLPSDEETFNWMNLFLLLMAILSVISCFIIAIFIYICLKKLRKEEKQYRNYLMSDTLSLRHPHPITMDHYQCPSRTFQCCDDHQLISYHETVPSNEDPSQSHQYECIPEYILTYPRSNIRRHDFQSMCTCSSSLKRDKTDPDDDRGESFTPLLRSTRIVGWTRRNSSLNQEKTNEEFEQKQTFLSQWRKSSLFE